MKKYTLSTISVSIILFFALPFVTFSQDGSLDITFDNNGIATTSIGTNSEAFAIAIQADGKIVAAGSSIVNNQGVITLTRYNTNGSLDNSFGNAGIVTTSIGTSSGAFAIAIQADGKIVAAGGSQVDFNTVVFTLTRFNTNGSLDNTFGNAGIVTTAIQETCFVSAIAIQADGKIVAAGVSQESFAPYVFTLTRYNTNGSLDLTFNFDGIVTTPIGTSSGGAMVGGIAIQDDGKIVIAGTTYNGSTSFSVFTLARYKTNGGLDNTFDSDGIVTTSIGTSNGGANAIAIQADGKIVAGGQAIGTPNLLQTHFALTRYNTNGSLDNTFGNAGIVTTSIGTSSHVSAIAIQADGKIVVAGTAFNFLSVFALRRYKTNGSLDNTFGSSGMVNTTYENANQANAIAIQADGKIVAAGRSYTEATPSTNGVFKFAVIRYNNSFTADISEYLNITSQISIYPNPFSNATTLKTNYLFENATLIVYNTLGEQVRKINNIYGQKFTFYRENLDEGIYFYQIEENNIIVSENRFVITD